jgi:hypothetical protein
VDLGVDVTQEDSSVPLKSFISCHPERSEGSAFCEEVEIKGDSTWPYEEEKSLENWRNERSKFSSC